MADLKPAYLLLGNDRSKMHHALVRMKGHFAQEAIEQYEASGTTAADIVATSSAMGLFADQRLIVVHGADLWKADDVSTIVDYVKSPALDTVLLLTAEKLASNSRLKKAFGPGTLVECRGPEKEPEVVQWATKRFAAHGVDLQRAIAQRLVSIVGFDSLDRLESDIARIVTYAAGEPITVELIDRLATPHTEEKVWALTDAWASRDRGALLRMTEQLLAQKEHPVRLAGVIGRHLRVVHTARRLLAHASPGQVQQQLVADGTQKWVAGKFVEQAQRVGLPQVDAALARVALLDAELKGGAALASGKIAGDRDASVIIFQRGLCELL